MKDEAGNEERKGLQEKKPRRAHGTSEGGA